MEAAASLSSRLVAPPVVAEGVPAAEAAAAVPAVAEAVGPAEEAVEVRLVEEPVVVMAGMAGMAGTMTMTVRTVTTRIRRAIGAEATMRKSRWSKLRSDDTAANATFVPDSRNGCSIQLSQPMRTHLRR